MAVDRVAVPKKKQAVGQAAAVLFVLLLAAALLSNFMSNPNSKTRRIPLESNAKVRLAIHERLFVEDENEWDMKTFAMVSGASQAT